MLRSERELGQNKKYLGAYARDTKYAGHTALIILATVQNSAFPFFP